MLSHASGCDFTLLKKVAHFCQPLTRAPEQITVTLDAVPSLHSSPHGSPWQPQPFMASQGSQGTRGAAGVCVFVSVKTELLELPPHSSSSCNFPLPSSVLNLCSSAPTEMTVGERSHGYIKISMSEQGGSKRRWRNIFQCSVCSS